MEQRHIAVIVGHSVLKSRHGDIQKILHLFGNRAGIANDLVYLAGYDITQGSDDKVRLLIQFRRHASVSMRLSMTLHKRLRYARSFCTSFFEAPAPPCE